MGLLPESGCLVCCGDDPLVMRVSGSARCRVVTYGSSKSCHWQIDDITPAGVPGAIGRVTFPGGETRELHLQVCGTHNLLNGAAVLAQAVQLGLEAEAVLGALGSFRGVARRLQKVADGGGIVLYDDFAHHPTAIKTTLLAVRRSHLDSRLWAIFEPRSNTMVRNFFQSELEAALALADRVVLGPLHRRDRIPREQRLDAAGLVKALKQQGVEATALENLDHAAENVSAELELGDVVVVMSNGSFGGLTGNLAGYINGLG